MSVAPPSHADPASVLASASVGQKLLFWFSPDLAIDGARPLLLLTPGAAAADRTALDAQAHALDLPLGALFYRGLASVGPAGTLRFAASGLTAEALETLSQWAALQSPNHAALGALRGATFLDVSPSGVVQAVHRDAESSRLIFPAYVTGTPQGSGALLDGLEDGDDAWFWMTDRGAGGAPAIAVSRVSDDPDAARVVLQAAALRGGGDEVRGVMRRTADGLALTTADDLATLERVGARLLDAWGGVLPALVGARLFHASAERLDAMARLPRRPGPSRQCAALEAVAGGTLAFFWFTDAAKDGEPLLLLGRSPGALAGPIAAHQGSGATTNGTLSMSLFGWYELRARSVAPTFLPALARWVARHRDGWPSLLRLADARALVVDGDGAVLDTIQDSEAWQALRP